MKEHPTPSEIALAAERFNERIALVEKLEAIGVEATSISI